MSSVSIGMTHDVAGNETLLREQVEDALERLSRMLVHSLDPQTETARVDDGLGQVRETVRFLGQVTSEWASVPPEALPAEGAAFGSEVLVEDLDQGTRTAYTLVAGPLIDFERGQVSLASPIGHALLGTRAGDVVTVDTPQRRRRLRVVSVRTLQQQISEQPWRKPAA